jgi:hypothetical protein
MDEDGQHNPEAIVDLHASALRFKSDLVYAELPPPSTHGWQRNFTSNLVKRHILPRVSDEKLQYFSSYRLILGEVARSVAAYVTSDVYLDIALSWVAREIRTCKIVSRGELRANSTYTRRKLIGHLIRLVLSSGTKPLRIGSLIGFISFLVGFLGALGVIFGKVSYGIEPVGWTSLASIVLIIGGLNLLILGIISEYIGIIVRTAIGRPVYVITNDRINGPLFRDGSQDL